MAKQKREIRRGDGFVQVRVSAAGRKRYQARWEEGNRYRSKTFDTLQDAEDHLRVTGRRQRAGTYTPEPCVTVDDVIAEYLGRGAARWSANTLGGYRTIARRHISPRIGRIRITVLTPRMVQNLLDSLVAKGLMPSTVANVRIVLSSACREAVSLGVIPNNPVSSARAPKRRRPTITVWTQEHITRVMQIATPDTMLRGLYTLALTTGMRSGEIRSLQWRDVDLDAGVVRVERSITRDERNRVVIGTTTKTNRIRTIAIPRATVAALRAVRTDQMERRLAAEYWRDTDLVFDRGDGNFLPQQRWARWHRKVCNLANVPYIKIHDLRHTAATAMLRNGVGLKIVSDILGHASIAITADVYSHPDTDMQRQATDILGQSLERGA